MSRRRIIIESPYAGDVETNVAYARACMRDSLERGEAPIASHLLYTQEGILNDDVPNEREQGIAAGLEWRAAAEAAVFYIDLGWSKGMADAAIVYGKENIPTEVRKIGWRPPSEGRGLMARVGKMSDHTFLTFMEGVRHGEDHAQRTAERRERDRIRQEQIEKAVAELPSADEA